MICAKTMSFSFSFSFYRSFVHFCLLFRRTMHCSAFVINGDKQPSQHVNANVLMKTMFNALLMKCKLHFVDLFVFFPLKNLFIFSFLSHKPICIQTPQITHKTVNVSNYYTQSWNKKKRKKS